MLELVANVHAFFDRLKVSGIEIYNEFSLQHELPGNCNGQRHTPPMLSASIALRCRRRGSTHLLSRAIRYGVSANRIRSIRYFCPLPGAEREGMAKSLAG